MKTSVVRNILGCLVISLVGCLGSVGVAILGDFALSAAFTEELPLIAASWPSVNAWPVLGLLMVQVVLSLLLGIAVASCALWWIADRFEAKR